jgi:hypothetical protein
VDAHISDFTATMDGESSKGNYRHGREILYEPRSFTDRPTRLVTIRNLGDEIPFPRHVLKGHHSTAVTGCFVEKEHQ